MTLEQALIVCSDAYCQAKGIARSTLSTQMLNESRTLDRVASGGSLTVRNWQRCMAWLSAAWPKGVLWPEGVERPEPASAEAA